MKGAAPTRPPRVARREFPSSHAFSAVVREEARRLPLPPSSLLILGDRVPPQDYARAASAAVNQEKMKRLAPAARTSRLPPTRANSPGRRRTLVPRPFKAKG